MNYIPLILLAGAVYWYTLPKRPTFQMIYNDTCPFCRKVMPTFKLLSVPGVAITWVKSQWSQFKVSGVPTFIYTDIDGVSEMYTGPRDLDSFTAYLESKKPHHK